MQTPFRGLRAQFVDKSGFLTEFWQRALAQVIVDAPAAVVLPFSATPIFDAAVANEFDITLTANVTGSTLINAQPGQILTFVIAQDGVGAHTFVWPTNLHNGAAPGAAANAITVQSFIVRSGGQLYPIAAATIN